MKHLAAARSILAAFSLLVALAIAKSTLAQGGANTGGISVIIAHVPDHAIKLVAHAGPTNAMAMRDPIL